MNTLIIDIWDKFTKLDWNQEMTNMNEWNYNAKNKLLIMAYEVAKRAKEL